MSKTGFKKFNVNGNEMPIRKFDLGKLKGSGGPPSIVMIAKRGSGKSVVCKHILSYFKDIPGGAIIAPSDEANPFYADFFPNLYIHHKFTTEKLERFWDRQKRMKRKKVDHEKKKQKTVDTRCFLLMDDCLASKGSWMKEQSILQVFFNGRHYDMMYVLTMQFPLGISPELRTNFDFVFLLADDYFSNQKRLYEHYAGMFPTFQAFRDVFIEITKDYGSMVVVNRGKREDIFDKIFWFKADTDIKIEKMGCKQFNYINDKNFNPNFQDEDNKFDLATFGKKKNQKILKVKKLEDD